MLEDAPPPPPCPQASQNHSLSLINGGAFLSLSRFLRAMVFLVLGGSHTLLALALGKTLTIIKPTFIHLHLFTKKPSFNGKLATHT